MMARDVALTRGKLLAAARAEFIAHGIAGSRVDRIAASAGVNKERIYGHFGSKEKLFQAAIAEAMGELAALVSPQDGSLPAFVGRIVDFHRRDPSFLRLLMWEALHYGAEPQDVTHSRQEWYTRQVQQLADSTGRSTSEAGLLLFSLIGLGAWPTAVPFTTFLDAPADDDGTWEEQLRAFIVDFVERATRE
ncbi:TetR/AcrR family transcriptional regulator [Streptomyces maoxianensis]|uniref:TetR/AcrR family transcriptional regulator n=1 Tax=Streptomyces maoxianensis TaxID=1459942 RepID=A0ABV9FWY5_9ACTN